MFFVLACTASEFEPSTSYAERTATFGSEGTGLTYEIYVRSFQDSDGDGFGDLNGVRSRLSHLDSLAVETIWLMPVFPAFGPAGYDVQDFDSITPEYGDEDDLAALVDEAHALGMRVVLDLPFNHVHREHPWFASAEAGAEDARDWFRYAAAPEDPGRWFSGAQGDYYYAYFGSELPDLNYDNARTRAEMERVFLQWVGAPVDGYRLDAVLTLDEDGASIEGTEGSHVLVGELIEAARAVAPDAWFLAEASEWEVDRSLSWVGDAESPGADAVLDFPRHDAFLEAVAEGDAAALVEVIDRQVAEGGVEAMAGFLGSHDLDRLRSTVPSAQARRAMRVAQFLLPGDPVLYYGEEVDLADATTGTGQDWAMRAPMPWDDSHSAGFSTSNAWFPPDPTYLDGENVDAQDEDPNSMLNLIRALSCVRDEHQLSGGNAWSPVSGSAPGVLAFHRSTIEGGVMVVVNLSPEAQPLDGIDVPAGLVDLSGTGRNGAPTETQTVEGYGFTVYGPPDGACVLPAR